MNKTWFTPVDEDAQRRHALAKVYALLLRLAEKAEHKGILPNKAGKEQIEAPSETAVGPESTVI